MRSSVLSSTDEDPKPDETRPLNQHIDGLQHKFSLPKRTRRKVFLVMIALLVAVVVATSITLGILLAFTPPKNILDLQKRFWNYEDIFNANLRPKYSSLNWLEGDSYSIIDGSGNLWKYEASSPSSGILLANASLISQQLGNVSFTFGDISPDSSKVLLITNYQQLWRHSFTAIFLIFDVATKTISNVTQNPIPLSNVKWASQSSDLLAFVRLGNIFYRNLSLDEEIQITFDGGINNVLNGVCSWVYEEEVFSDYNAMFWSPDDSSLVFIKFDETQVPVFTIPLYQQNPYTNYLNIKYPKPGYPNPVVSLWIYSIELNNTVSLNINTTGDTEYITYVQWNVNNTLLVKVMPRIQNKEYALLFSDFQSGTPLLLWELVNNYWIDTQPVVMLPDLNSYVTLWPSNGFMHVARFSSNGTLVAFLTSGSFDVIQIVGYYSPSKSLYFISAETSPLERQVYSINALNGSQKTRISTSSGWYSATFSSSGKYFVLTYGGPNIPSQYLLSVTDPKYQIVLEDNSQLKNNLNYINMPNKTFFTIPNGEGTLLNAYAIYPPNFDPSKKYAVLMNVYGGPGSQTVTKAFESNGFHFYLASQFQFIIVSVDNRGTGARGDLFMKQTYLRLGVLETEDQIAAAKGLASLFDYIDSTRLAIWGWSYGGFMTSSIMSTVNNGFKLGISVAPVTDWKYYDSVYTERYMQTPLLNPIGYANTSVVNRAQNILNGQFMLVHGTGDDNVHFQNSAELALALIQNNIQFETMYYPNYNHGISARRHLYTVLSNFLKNL